MVDDEVRRKIHKAAAKKAFEAYVEEVTKGLDEAGMSMNDLNGLKEGQGGVVVTPDQKEMIVVKMYWELTTDDADLSQAMGKVVKNPGLAS